MTLPPSLAVIRKIAQGLHVTSDQLIFDDAERRPDEGRKMMFEAVDQFDETERANAKELIKVPILRNQTNKWNLGT